MHGNSPTQPRLTDAAHERACQDILDAAAAVRAELGPDLLEHVYKVCLAHLLTRKGHEVVADATMPIEYDGQRFEEGYQVDLLVDGTILVLVRSIESGRADRLAHLQNFLRLGGCRVGFLLDYRAAALRDGITRVVRVAPEGGREGRGAGAG